MDEMNRLYAKVDAMDQKLDQMSEALAGMAIILERNTVDVERHIRRTDLLEKQLLEFKTYIKAFHLVLGGIITIAGLLFSALRLL